VPSIQVDITELSRRPTDVKQLLRPLVRNPDPRRSPGYIQCQRASIANRRLYVLAAHDGAIPNSDYQDWRFSTYRRDFRCKYYEVWKSIDDRFFTYELNRAYFTLFRVYRAPLREDSLFALHSDPITGDTEPHAFYKQGPHLHMDFAEDPLPHAHIALNRSHLEDTLVSVESLSTALSVAVNMLREQVLTLHWPEFA